MAATNQDVRDGFMALQADAAGARTHQRLAHRQLRLHVPLGI
jgi:hypothetical protein